MMKRIILLAFLIFTYVRIEAQSVKFDGIPLGTSLSTFDSKIKAKGYKTDPISKLLREGSRTYVGKYKGYNVTIAIEYGVESRKVYGLVLDFGKDESYQTTEKKYDLCSEVLSLENTNAEHNDLSDELTDEEIDKEEWRQKNDRGVIILRMISREDMRTICRVTYLDMDTYRKE